MKNTRPEIKRPQNRFRSFMHWSGAVVTVLLLLASSCTRPAEEQEQRKEEKKHVYKDLKPEVYPVPGKIKDALPGLLNDNIYVYREIAKTVNLVAYVPDYSREAAIKMMSEAFLALSGKDELRKDIDFWIIQIQPQPPGEEAQQSPGNEGEESQVVVWGVRPAEVDQYKQSGDLAEFLKTSEYLLVDDEIIAKGEERMESVPGIKGKPAQEEAEEPGKEQGKKEPDEPARDAKPVNR